MSYICVSYTCNSCFCLKLSCCCAFSKCLYQKASVHAVHNYSDMMLILYKVTLINRLFQFMLHLTKQE